MAEAVASEMVEPSAAAVWRIDDLARRAGVTVDTIRYYQREGLLRSPRRSGRRKLYGPDHLERLEEIRALQARRFSLAAIRELLESERAGVVAGIFGDETVQAYEWDELVERAGIDPALAEATRTRGLLRDPAQQGRDAWDAADLRVLRAVGRMERAGVPREVLLALVEIYVRHFDVMQRETLALFTGRGSYEVSGDELEAFQLRMADAVPSVMPAADQLLDYVHRRTLQRLALDAVAEAREREQTGG